MKPGVKRCKTCKQSKYKVDFYRRSDRYKEFATECKVCYRRRRRLNYKKNPKMHKNFMLKKTYGITLKQFNQMLKIQGHSCSICNKHKRNETKMLHVDHNHLTGNVRGLLCQSCNLGLGRLKGDLGIDILLKAVAYLRKTDGR